MKKRLLNYTLTHEDGAWVAQCAEVDVTNEGDSEAVAVAKLIETLTLYGANEGWEPMLMPPDGYELTEEDRGWLNSPSIGRETL